MGGSDELPPLRKGNSGMKNFVATAHDYDVVTGPSTPNGPAQSLQFPKSEPRFTNAAPAFDYSMRMCTAADMNKIERFYIENKHPQVDTIDHSKVEGWAAAGRFFLIEDSAGQIIVSSAAKNYNKDNKSWMEVGAILSHRQKTITDVYAFLNASLVWNEVLTRPPSEVIFTSLYSDNPNLPRLNKEVGWDVIQPTEDLFVHEGDPELYKSGAVTWLASPPQCLFKQASILVDQIEKGGFICKKTGEIKKADFSHFAPCAQHFGRVKEFADIYKSGSSVDLGRPLTYADFAPKSGS